MFRMAWVGVLAFLADRISKQLVIEGLQAGSTKVLWDGVLNLTYTQNTGMAFSILADRTWLLIVLSAFALVLMVAALQRALQNTPLQQTMLWLLLAGGLGNLIDRLFFGYVVDFLNITLIKRFPVFNVADICLSIAAAFLMVALLRNPDAPKTSEEHAS